MRRTVVAVVTLITMFSACGSSAPAAQVRSADDVQVLTPGEVKKIRADMAPLTTDAPTLDSAAGAAPSGTGVDAASTDTVPLNKDNRPPELRLFDAYAKFKSCIEDAGQTIKGNLQDPKNPAYKDPEYVKVITTCAARSDILSILKEMQTTRANLKPDEVETRNKAFKLLQKCLVDKGWKIETATDKIGLINPSVFQSADGTLNQRDINQCLSSTGINDAIKGNG